MSEKATKRRSGGASPERVQLIRRLHAAAVEACERTGIDLDPHELARQACHVSSLRDATEPVLRNGIRVLQRSDEARRSGQQTRQSAQRPARPRRARPTAPGVIKLPTPKALNKMFALARKLFTTVRELHRMTGLEFVRREDGYLTLKTPATAGQVNTAINSLMGECLRRGID